MNGKPSKLEKILYKAINECNELAFISENVSVTGVKMAIRLDKILCVTRKAIRDYSVLFQKEEK